MTSSSELDLCGIAWPLSLLEFKCALNGTCSCDVLDVLTQDPDVVKNITIIVNCSEDRIITQQQEGDVYRLSIQRG